MIERAIQELGPWSWWVLGFVLLAAELVAPGVFLIWIGVAALVVGILSLLLWEIGFWTWQVQFVLFALFAVVAVVLGRRLVLSSSEASDEPLLNRRAESLVGRTAVLDKPIAEGRGRIRLDDTFWIIEGPDLPAGTRVRVVSTHGRNLTVESA
ncbi:NfeD family protein [Ensifer adhaerens]|uniref:NfeD family protein n=1 Tax=Ensifer adhaerens TaxID=106592 RepID=UPI001CBC3061|nr:NfeD family protein [Ensifer adhaerens]MBZ7923251.1 NfeD family protein [Ensifer adhaerens]UAX91829.1 NfeD family protein [Ensifer adhaerens]UAX99457.1 NfeD family protein [Ensifer adhaerens]UAY06840.1 NfeD family protein [Ensifer adhaerens]